MFREFSSKETNLELLRLGDTRFGTNFIMLERLQNVKTPIQQMIVSLEWKKWMCSDEKEDVECAFFSNQFWKLLTLIVKVIEPIFNLMRLVDSGKLTTRKFYEYYDQLMEKINEMDGLTSKKKKEIIIND